MDSPFLTVLMVTGAGRECKESRRVRGYEGTAIYWRYGEVVERHGENRGALCAERRGYRCRPGCGRDEAEP